MYNCDICDYDTGDKSNYNRHLRSKKHKKCEKAEKIQQRLIQLKTNYSDKRDLYKQCRVLKKTLNQIQKEAPQDH